MYTLLYKEKLEFIKEGYSKKRITRRIYENCDYWFQSPPRPWVCCFRSEYLISILAAATTALGRLNGRKLHGRLWPEPLDELGRSFSTCCGSTRSFRRHRALRTRFVSPGSGKHLGFPCSFNGWGGHRPWTGVYHPRGFLAVRVSQSLFGFIYDKGKTESLKKGVQKSLSFNTLKFQPN